MQFHKIKQYNVLELIHILLFRIVYKIKLLLRKVYVSLTHPTYKALQGQNVDGKYQRLCSSLYSYYGFVRRDAQIKDKADSILRGRTSVFGHEYPFNPETDWLKDPESGKRWPVNRYWDQSKFIEKGLSDVKLVLEINKFNDVVTLAQAYYITKDERYVQEVERYLNGWVKCIPMEYTVVNKIVMDFGFRVINLIHVSLLCGDSDYFRSRVHPLALGIMKHHVNHLWRYLSSRWFKSGNDNNHNIGEIVGLYSGQLWLSKFGYGGGILYNRRLRKELSYLKEVTNKLIPPSGCYLEQSASYTRLVHDFFLFFEIMRHSLDYNRSFGWFDTSDYFEKLSEYLINISYHGQLPNFGDNDYARVVIPFEEKDNVIGHVLKHCRRIPETRDYSADGQLVYHSEDNNDIFIFTRIGLFAGFVEGAFVHSHNDLLSIILSAKGKPIFIDKGTLFYNSGLDIRKEYTSTGSHNTIIISGKEMADYLPIGFCNYPKSRLKSLENNKSDNFRFIGEVTYKDIIHQREIDYDGKCITIKDEVINNKSIKEKGTLRFLLAENNSPTIEGNSISIINNDKDLLCVINIEGVESIVIKDTFYAPHYALRRKTCLVEAIFEIDNQKSVKTIIEIV